MSTIKVIKIETGYQVFFPFELKDNFRSIFKSAKWNPMAKCWEVGTRSKTRLENWVEAVQSTADAIVTNAEEEAAARISENELFAIEQEMKEIQKTLALAKEIRANAEKTKEFLEPAKAELEAAKAELVAAKKEAVSALNEAKAFVSKVIDVEAVTAAHQAMCKNHGEVGSQAREAFNSACWVMREQNDKLKELGFYSPALDALYHMNFNRPQRDIPRSININIDIYTLEKLEDDSN
ncbi:hypothetical protein VQ643_04310 [Pseudomonas sp. F1_0610]|uniref:hypothetical protein n=1 Tax=Pseudomonas sp. F1_0610 TaxID=3114284 RepID=UPI0039C3EC38